MSDHKGLKAAIAAAKNANKKSKNYYYAVVYVNTENTILYVEFYHQGEAITPYDFLANHKTSPIANMYYIISGSTFTLQTRKDFQIGMVSYFGDLSKFIVGARLKYIDAEHQQVVARVAALVSVLKGESGCYTAFTEAVESGNLRCFYAKYFGDYVDDMLLNHNEIFVSKTMFSKKIAKKSESPIQQISPVSEAPQAFNPMQAIQTLSATIVEKDALIAKLREEIAALKKQKNVTPLPQAPAGNRKHRTTPPKRVKEANEVNIADLSSALSFSMKNKD